MRGLFPALVALAVVLAVALGVVIALIIGSGGLIEEAADETAAPTTTRTAMTTAPTPRTRATTTTPTTTRSGAVCDARVINSDQGYPGSGSRIIDCGGGWAVMASEHSGDPYWVAFRNGRWRSVDDVSMYLMTCPEEAIAKGAPAWLARKHLDCRTVDPATSTRPSASRPSRTSTSSRAPSPSRTPSSSPSAETSTITSESTTTSEDTTTTSPGDEADE